MRRLQIGVILAAAACALVPFPPAAVERWFSAGLYPRIQRVVTGASNAVPFAVFDLFLVAAATAVVALLTRGVIRARRAHRFTPILASIFDIISASALVYLAFLLLWGLNYQRLSMSERLDVRQGAPSPDAVLTLGRRAASQLNALHESAHATGWGGADYRDEPLLTAFGKVQRFFVEAPPAEPGRLKHTIFGPYFRWTGVDGMVNPFALEVLANPDLLPFERPFVAAHEWAHLAGYANESEASFVGWLTCIRADVPARYSGWLSLYWQVSGEVDARTRGEMAATLSAGPKGDVEAIADRLRRGQLPALRTASWAVYDRYLKAHHVAKGVQSYGVVVTLILQTRFDDEWAPVRREAVGGRQ